MPVVSVGYKRDQEDFALLLCIMQQEGEPPPGEPTEHIDRFAHGVIIHHDICTKAAFEVVWHLSNNLKARMRYGGVDMRFASLREIKGIARHALDMLKALFQPYSDQLTEYPLATLRERAYRIAGICHCEPDANPVTGRGVHVTGLTKLYYDQLRVAKLGFAAWLIGWKDPYVLPTYSPRYPGVTEIDGVVCKILNH